MLKKQATPSQPLFDTKKANATHARGFPIPCGGFGGGQTSAGAGVVPSVACCVGPRGPGAAGVRKGEGVGGAESGGEGRRGEGRRFPGGPGPSYALGETMGGKRNALMGGREGQGGVCLGDMGVGPEPNLYEGGASANEWTG